MCNGGGWINCAHPSSSQYITYNMRRLYIHFSKNEEIKPEKTVSSIFFVKSKTMDGRAGPAFFSYDFDHFIELHYLEVLKSYHLASLIAFHLLL